MKCWRAKVGFWTHLLLNRKIAKNKNATNHRLLDQAQCWTEWNLNWNQRCSSQPYADHCPLNPDPLKRSSDGAAPAWDWELVAPECCGALRLSTSFSLLNSEKGFAFYQACPEKYCLKKCTQNNFSRGLKVTICQMWGQRNLGMCLRPLRAHKVDADKGTNLNEQCFKKLIGIQD